MTTEDRTVSPDGLDPAGQLDLLRAIASLEAKLTTSMNMGLQHIQRELSSLNEAHHRAILDQERRNATFASRERVDELQLQLHELERQTSNRALSFLSSSAGYLFTLIVIAGTAVLTFILAHAVH